MEEYKFSDSNLDFNELLDKYKVLDTTYSDTTNFKINIYENCNLLQDLTTVTTGTAFTVPSTNIRLSSFKNNYIIADTQTLDLDQAFYTVNPTLFTKMEGVTYINNINLTNIITTYFNYTNDYIYPSKKIIIKINLPKEIVDTNGSGALQIDMKEIKEHFHSVFDTLELDINQYVTGKHGTLAATGDAQEPPNNDKGGSGQNANVNSAGPAINITYNNPSYFQLNIKTNGKVSGGFGASGGRGGNGKINATEYSGYYGGDTEFYSPLTSSSLASAKFVFVYSDLEHTTSGGAFGVKTYYWKNTTYYYWNGLVAEYPMENIPIGSFLDYLANQNPPTLTPTSHPETLSGSITHNADTNVYTKHTYQYVAGAAVSGSTSLWKIKKLEYTYTRTGAFPPTTGNEGSTATYSNNAEDVFPTQVGAIGTARDGTGGTGGTAGIQGEITNITTAANITIEPIEP